MYFIIFAIIVFRILLKKYTKMSSEIRC